MKSKWEFNSQYDSQVISEMMQQLHVPRPVARVLFNRGLRELEDVKRFVRPSTEHLHDPFLMRDMDKAVDRLILALREQEKILIHGDYDVDGITSTSLLYLFLKDLGGKVFYFIPDRTSEGYGISSTGLEAARTNGCSLIVTVDCGITSFEEVKNAQAMGIDIIVSDHHEVAEQIPEALAVIDPKRKDCDYPFKELAGVGVAYKLAQGITQNLNLDKEYIEKYLDLAAIGSAADIVPLVDENRVFVRLGLEKINTDGLEGITTLIETAGLHVGSIDVGRIIYGLAPRMNAVGRLGSASPAVELLITRNHQRAHQIARQLEEENNRRKEIDTRTLNEALTELPHYFNAEQDSAIVLAKDGWHPGVIGIVASRFIERFFKPTVMISIDNGIGKGSARSVPNYDLHSALKKCSDLLIQFGGHKYAAGLSIKEENIPQFRERFNQVTAETLTADDFVPKIKIDDELTFDNINQDLINMLDRLQPFGPRNSMPIFISENLEVMGEPHIVGREHLKFNVRQNGVTFGAIAFGRGSEIDRLKANRTIDLVYNLEKNRWMDQSAIRLKVKDLR